ncbi:hypothetical protein D3C76_1507740 [compost metagenome]
MKTPDVAGMADAQAQRPHARDKQHVADHRSLGVKGVKRVHVEGKRGGDTEGG